MPPLHHRLGHSVRHLNRRAVHHLRNTFIPHAGNNYHPHAFRHRGLNIAGGILIAAKIATAVFVAFYAQQASVTSVTPEAVISLSNKARQAKGLSVLKPNPLLMQAASAKARDMVTKGYFAHISPARVTPWTWFKKAGYNYSYAGENLAIDFVSSEDIIKAWLASPSHRANLLSTRYKDIGVATATGNIGGAESLVVVQMFGAPVKPAVVKKPTVPAQTPEPAKTKKVLAQKPNVLGETAPLTPPTAPRIQTPAVGTVVRTATPTFVGVAEAGSVVTVTANGKTVASGTVPANGVFSLVATAPLTEGAQAIQVVTTARKLTSQTTALNFTIDTQPPSIDLTGSYSLSILGTSKYLLSIPASADVATVVARSGDVTSTLKRQGDRFVGTIELSRVGALAGSIGVTYADSVGNALWVPIVDTNQALTGVAAAPEGPAAHALRVLFFSRAFMMTFFVIIFLIGAINVAMNWRRRHHPALLGMILLLYVAGTLTWL